MKKTILISILIFSQLALADALFDSAEGAATANPRDSYHMKVEGERPFAEQAAQAKKMAEADCLKRIESNVNEQVVSQFYEFAVSKEGYELYNQLFAEIRAAREDGTSTNDSYIRERMDIQILIRYSQVRKSSSDGKAMLIAALKRPSEGSGCLRREAMYNSLTKLGEYRPTRSK